MIHKLPQDVINKIAAGEIVQRPYSVVKELVENSIDAGSTSISIHIVNAGLDVIKIIDDGHGVLKEDFDLLCERYATSKICTSDDMHNISTFGFRGEALASITFVATMQVTSKRHNEELGYQGKYKDSRLETLIPIGSNNGTTIEVNQLFYNLQIRRDSINKLDEKKSILKLIQSLSIHHQDVQFKLYIDKSNDFSSTIRMDCLANILKVQLNQLIEGEYTNDELKYRAQFVCTKLSALKLRKEICLFINNRLVESEQLRKAVLTAYQNHYQCIHDELGGFYVYLSIDMNPKYVDPNVHPNKKEIKFINELEISKDIQEWLYKYLGGQNVQKQLKQTQLFESTQSQQSQQQPEKFRQSLENALQKQKVRIDPKLRTLDEMLFNKVKQSQFAKSNDHILGHIMKFSNTQAKDILNQMVYVGLFGKQQLLAQIQNKLFLINMVPLLFNMFWCQIGHGTIDMQIYPNDLVDFPYHRVLEELHFNFQQDELITCPCKPEYLKQIQQLDFDDSLGLIINSSRLIAEQLSLEEYNENFIKNQLFPYLKSHNIIALEFDYQQILCTDDLYSIFERC